MVPPNSRGCFSGFQICLVCVVILASAVHVTSQAASGAGASSCSTEEHATLCVVAEKNCYKYSAGGTTTFECCGVDGCSRPACPETDSISCHNLAQCSMETGEAKCSCEAGLFGSGVGSGGDGSSGGCDSNSWALRTVVNLPNVACDSDDVNLGEGKLTNSFWNQHRKDFADLFFVGGAPDYVMDNMLHDAYPASGTTCVPGDGIQLSIAVLYGRMNKTEAVEAAGIFADNLNGADRKEAFGVNLNDDLAGGTFSMRDDIITFGPRLYRFVAGTTADAIPVPAVGFAVEAVSFKTTCMSSGCWVIDVVFSAGKDNMLVFYIPKTGLANGDINNQFVDELTYDFNYNVAPPQAPWNEYSPPKSIDSTFQPNNFPCSTLGYDNTAAKKHLIESCCLAQFVDLYRPVASFAATLAGEDEAGSSVCPGAQDTLSCASLLDEAVCSKEPTGGTYGSAIPKIQAAGGAVDAGAGVFGLPSFSRFGRFAGMAESNIALNGVIDASQGFYRAQLQLDNVELRRFAGQLVGTVGVQYTVDTFVGLADLRPTGGSAMVLDAAASQTALHLEKTDFFTVASHGVNDYTFVTYVNLRLMEVLVEDTDRAEDLEENSDRSVRTDDSDPAQFLQLTFQLGSKYAPMNENTPQAELIPPDGLRVGWGTQAGDPATQDRMFHACQEYADPTAENTVFTPATTNLFNSRFSWGVGDGSQSCSPSAPMCSQPQSITDMFVSFNVPLGVDWLPEAGGALEAFVFLQLVVTAMDKAAKSGGGAAPNSGGAPWQVKTTIFAEIPVVEGGRYVYCDAVTAKTDLKDVVAATLIFGTARDDEEFTRLRVFDDVGSSVLSPQEPEFFTSSSIEAGMMTLVLEGAATYFDTGTGEGSDKYGLQLEDVITVHIMEEEKDFEAEGTASRRILDLLALPGQDNYDETQPPAELRTLGYNLNGAFRFTIDRSANTASLEPTRALLDICQYNPPRPSLDDVFPTTCVLRKDVDGKQYLSRDGSFQTAMEVAPPAASTSDNEAFIASFLGDSDYSSTLGASYSRLLASKFALNGRYNRAYWINPGYEWTPTQTGNQQIFVVSQKLFVFALVTLDEEWSDGSRRAVQRRLLAGTTDTENAGSALSGQTTVGFASDKRTVLAATFGQPEEHVTTWTVEMELLRGQACNQDKKAVKKELTQQLQAAFAASASKVEHVQVSEMTINMKTENCFRVNRDGAGSRREGEGEVSTATASAEVLVVFGADKAKVNPDLLAEQSRVLAAQPLGELPEGYELDPNWVPGTEEEGTNMMPIIAGAAGGVGGCLLLAGAGYMMMRGRGGEENVETFAVEQSELKAAMGGGLDANDLRGELPAELGDISDIGKARLSEDQINELKAHLSSQV